MKAIAAIVICSILPAGARQAPPPAPIRIRVVNVAHVPGPELAAAEEIVGHIFQSAGLDPEWLDCDLPARPCNPGVQNSDLWLQILPTRPRVLEPGAAGYALLTPDCISCGYAAVSYAAVQAISRQWKCELTTLLGAAMAHELGHLLLGARHSADGVMAAHFRREAVSRAGRGELLFDAKQAKELRKAGQIVRAAK